MENENTETSPSPEVTKNKTYMCLQNEGGMVEIDLVTFREKGELTKFLSIGLLTKNKQNEGQELSMNFNEESFDLLKKFFQELEWNS